MDSPALAKFESGSLGLLDLLPADDLDLDGLNSLFNDSEDAVLDGVHDFDSEGPSGHPCNRAGAPGEGLRSGSDDRPSGSTCDPSMEDMHLIPTDAPTHAAAAGTAQRAAPRRRRRTRTAKQQELNRLAQQRYRERKKQKYSHLQGTVEELSEQLHQLALLREQNATVSEERNQLALLAHKQKEQLAQQQQQLTAQAEQLLACKQQAAEQQQQIEALSQQLAGACIAQTPAADELSEQLACAVKAALHATSLGALSPVQGEREQARVHQVVSGLPERVLQQFMASCREVVRHLHPAEPAEGRQAIQVPCC